MAGPKAWNWAMHGIWGANACTEGATIRGLDRNVGLSPGVCGKGGTGALTDSIVSWWRMAHGVLPPLFLSLLLSLSLTLPLLSMPRPLVVAFSSCSPSLTF